MTTTISNLVELYAAVRAELGGDFLQAEDIDASITNPATPAAGWDGTAYAAGSWVTHADKTWYCATGGATADDEPGDSGQWIEAWVTANGWLPIGTSGTPFAGVYDGGGHNVTGLFLERTATDNCGLFGYSTGTIRNLTVSGSVYGNRNVGGVVGYAFSGVLSNVHSAASARTTVNTPGGLVGNVGAVAISDCSASGNVIAGTNGAGGLSGYMGAGSSIIRSHATGNVTGAVNCGGLSGSLGSGTATQCWASGDVQGTSPVGGLIGNCSSSTISQCYATGNVSGGVNAEVGGCIGHIETGSSTSFASDCYATGVVTGSGATPKVGGFVGYAINASASRCWCLSPPATPLDEGGMGPTFSGGAFGTSQAVGSYWNRTISGNEGLMTPDTMSATAKTTEELQTWNTFPYDSSIWTFPCGLDDNYPVLVFSVGGQMRRRNRRSALFAPGCGGRF